MQAELASSLELQSSVELQSLASRSGELSEADFGVEARVTRWVMGDLLGTQAMVEVSCNFLIHRQKHSMHTDWLPVCSLCKQLKSSSWVPEYFAAGV